MDWELDACLQETLLKMITEGYRQSEVLSIVSKQFRQYSWSSRTLRRRLNHFRIKKHDDFLKASDVLHCVKNELDGPGRLLGYRSMYKRLRLIHKMKVKMEQVYLAMRLLDPEGLQERKLVNKRKKFRRRVFTSKGPNWMWSIDGHDKLMGWHKSEYPLAIHGCVDTFSRKIIWLKAWPSNSSPQLPAMLYSEVVKSYKVLPHFIRADRGNENTTLFALHNFLRGTADGSSFLYGSSITNQVIERWWRDLRERNGNYFRQCLDSLSSTGLYNSGDETCRVILATILIPLLQHELDIFKECWNSHRIRKQNIKRPCGIPNFLYDYPEAHGCQSAGYDLDSKRMDFMDDKLGLTSSLEFVPANAQKCIQKILSNSNLFPITFSNFTEAYKLIFTGCKTNSIQLKFQQQ